MPAAYGAELSTTDVDPEWFERASYGESPLPSRPLSSVYLEATLIIPPGQVSGELTIPTVADTVDEPDEHIRLEASASGGEEFEPLGWLTGTVTD